MTGLNMVSFLTVGHVYKVRTSYNKDKTFAAKVVSLNEKFVEFASKDGYRSLLRTDDIIDVCDLSRVM